MNKLKVSALNLVPIREGQDDSDALNDMIDLAQHLEQVG